MPPLGILLKPASGRCNMHCAYCFYKDETSHRDVALQPDMTTDCLKTILARAGEYAEGAFSIGFQGGEPTLRGLPFFRQAMELEKQYYSKTIPVFHAIQTNGYSITEEWASFFRQNRFLVGLSIDGPMSIHNANRKDLQGECTYAKVMQTAALFQKAGVDFNVLTVVTAKTALQIQKLYRFFMQQKLVYQQYIPCIDAIGTDWGDAVYSLTADLYYRFLMDLFEEWYRDRSAGRFVYIRYFENLAAILAGKAPESCGVIGPCRQQFVIEANGDVYPCDFYMTDEYRLGNILEKGFAELAATERAKQFLENSKKIPDTCLQCVYRAYCNGGCMRYRVTDVYTDPEGKHVYCESMKAFFEVAIPKIKKLVIG